MVRIHQLLAAIASFSACGCVNLKPEPFRLETPAAQLTSIPSPSAEPAGGERPVSEAPAPAENKARMASVAQATAPSPASGASARVDRILVASTSARLPRRAPDFSPEQTAAMICTARRAGFSDRAAREAHEATLEARRLRAAFQAGEADIEDADRAELARQSAVRAALSLPFPLLDIVVFGIQKKGELPAPQYEDLRLSDVDLLLFEENGRPAMIVTGTISNTGSTTEETPPVTIQAIDQWDYVIAGQTALLPIETLAAGASARFEIRFFNPPDTTAEVHAHFAPPFSFRSRRDCDFIDPAVFGPEESLADLPEGETRSIRRMIADALDPYRLKTAQEATDLRYAPSELNTLTRYFRSEAIRGWRCRQRADASCAGADQRLDWRGMFRIAEAADEAWIAVSAAESAERALKSGLVTPDEAVAAGVARTAALTGLQRLGAATLSRAGSPVPGIVITISRSDLVQTDRGLFLEIEAEALNASGKALRSEALLIAMVDRAGLPLASLSVPEAFRLDPEGREKISLQIPVLRSGRPQARGRMSESPAIIGRIPPEDIAWELRIGAMSGTGAES